MNEAEIKRTKAALDLARLNLSYTIIVAPYDGVTGRRTIQEGQFVQAGQNLLTFARDSDKWVVANYKESALPGLWVGKGDADAGRWIRRREGPWPDHFDIRSHRFKVFCYSG